ncbi:MAG: primosomal protein N' [bacterium]|nr:primosomal protein N' [bacterium]
MYIIEVIPLITLPPQVPQLLSYFFNKTLPRGSIVEVLIGNRKVPAVVTSSATLEDKKISLKKFGFQLKKISSIISEEPKLTDIQFKIASWLSKNYYAPPGLSFKTLLPQFFLNPKYPFSYPKIAVKDIREPLITPKLLLINAKKIIDELKSKIPKVISHGQQVLIIVPEISVAKYFYDILAGYYETALIHSKIGIKQNYKDWLKISSGDVEVIIGTRQALFAPLSNLGLIIIEDPTNVAYKSDMSPKYNARDLALKISEFYSADILLISQIPDIISYYFAKNNLYKLENKKVTPRIDTKIEDMSLEIKSGNFSIFSRELVHNIDRYAMENKKILMFSTRKGFSSYMICENCGFYFKCPQCSIALRLHKLPEQMLICHRCSFSQKIPESCSNCYSYKLKGGGFAGSDKIKNALDLLLKNRGISKPIFVLDSSVIQKPKQELDLIEQITKSDSFICIATQAIFSHRFNLKFDIIGITNLDGLTTSPDFKTEEELFIQFEKLLDFEPEKVIIQTFNPGSSIINSLAPRNFSEFYDRELMARKLFMYPPFARLVKLSFSAYDRSKASYEARVLDEKLKMVLIQKKIGDRVKILGSSPAFIDKEKNRYIYNIILKFSPEFRIDEIIRFVPSNWSVDIDPRSIL